MRQCSQCHKASVIRGKRRLLRGHYNPVSQERKYPNLQYVKIDGVRKLVCTACMRTMVKVKRAPAKVEKRAKS